MITASRAPANESWYAREEIVASVPSTPIRPVLVATTARRTAGERYGAPIVVANAAHAREVQDQLDRRHEDPDGPGLHESRRQIADET